MQTNQADGGWADERRRLRHELRTPVNHILSYAELVREDAEERGLTSVAAEMAHIERAGKATLVIVNSYMESPRKGTGEDPEHAELAGLMQEVMRRVEWLSRSRAVKESPDIATDLERISAAAQRLLSLVGAD